MEKKYEILKDTKTSFLGRKIYKIRALKDFADVKKGDIGGFVESENNLSQDGDCWIYENAKVSGFARVCGNTVVCGNARVSDNATICGNARVSDNARVFGNGRVFGNVTICGDDVVFDENVGGK